VWGLTLTYDGRPIYPYYHAACAGRTSDGEQYFNMPGLLPYARSVECSHCFRSPFHGKKRSVVPYRVYQQALNGAVPVISRIDAAGRPVELMMDNGKSVSGYDFWIKVGQKLGWDKVPGTRYDLMVAKDGSVVFESSGAGHGVGLCQWGAAELARQGWSCRSILKHYFPGTRVAGR
jgi:stage II sporulation protein D